jgi:hypothetical protein
LVTLSFPGVDPAHVYFPMSGVVLVSVMDEGQGVETAVVGREGAVGAFANLGLWNAFSRATVQIPATIAVISVERQGRWLCGVLRGWMAYLFCADERLSDFSIPASYDRTLARRADASKPKTSINVAENEEDR